MQLAFDQAGGVVEGRKLEIIRADTEVKPNVALPAWLTGSTDILGEPYPLYRLFVIATGLVVLALLTLLLDHTRLGATVRASVDHRDAAMCLGIDTDRLFLGVFALGSLLAGLAGVIAAPVLSVFPGMDMQVLVLALIIVVAMLLLWELGLGNWTALVVAPLLVGASGLLIERLPLRRVYRLDHKYGLLLTFGIGLVIEGRFRSGSAVRARRIRRLPLTGGQRLGFMFLPKHRACVVAAFRRARHLGAVTLTAAAA